jgi:hypothetical protein
MSRVILTYCFFNIYILFVLIQKEPKKSKPALYMKCRGLYVFLDNSKIDFGHAPKLAFLRQAQTWVLSQSQRSKSSLRIVTQKSKRPLSFTE